MRIGRGFETSLQVLISTRLDRRAVIWEGHMVKSSLASRRADANKLARSWAEIGAAQQRVIGESNCQSRKQKIQ